MKDLKWPGIEHFSKMKWTPLDDPESPGVTGAFVKNYKNFAFYWILKAGHMVSWFMEGGETILHFSVALFKNYFYIMYR